MASWGRLTVRLGVARQRYLIAFSAGIVSIIVNANSLVNGFAYDDVWIISNRELVHGIGRGWEIVTSQFWSDAFEPLIYRPLTLLTFAVDWQVWGGDPFGFHLTNVVLHAVVTVLLVFFLSRFFPIWAAWAGGLVFAVHSVHTEAVANVVGRAEILTALFILIGCLVYMRAVRRERISLTVVALLAILYTLAGFSKEVGFVMPGLLLATDLPLLARTSTGELGRFTRARLPLYASLAGVLALLFLVRLAVLGTLVGSVPARTFALDDSFTTRLFTMARVWPRFFDLLLFPLDLSADYSPAVILPASGLTLGGAFGFVLVILTIALAVVAFRRLPEFSMAVMWSVVALIPVSNLLIMVETVLGERRLYLPSISVSIVVALALARAPATRRRLLGAAVVAWVGFFSVVTIRRNPVWASTDAVFADLLRHHPESSRVLFGLGQRHQELGNYAEARIWMERSLEIWPWYAPYQAKFATTLMDQGRFDEAEARARRAIELDPQHRGNYKLLLLILLLEKKYPEAVAVAERAITTVDPDASLYTQKADAHAGIEDFEAAALAQEKAIREGRENWSAWSRLARFRVAAGDTVRALDALRRARIAPGAGAHEAEADSLGRAWIR